MHRPIQWASASKVSNDQDLQVDATVSLNWLVLLQKYVPVTKQTVSLLGWARGQLTILSRCSKIYLAMINVRTGAPSLVYN